MVSDAAVEAIGGAVGACVAIGLTYPLTTVATWQALEHKKSTDDNTQGNGEKYSLVPKSLQLLYKYAKTNGWQALFAGLRPCLAATTVSQAVYFYSYSTIRQAVVTYKHGNHGKGAAFARTADIGVAGSIIVASLAGCINVLSTNPVWVVATQMQALQRHPDPAKRNMSAFGIAKMLYEEGGLAAFCKGLAPALVMVSNPTMQYIMYEFLTARVLEMRRRGAASGTAKPRLSARDVFLLSAMAKMAASLVTYPFLLIKSRMQAANSSTAAEARYKGVVDAVVRILRTEGFKGLFKGSQLKITQTVLAAALLMAIKEQVYHTTRTALQAADAALHHQQAVTAAVAKH